MSRRRQSFCERADDYCPRKRKPQLGSLESLAVLALLYVGATALMAADSGDARGGAAPQLKPPRKTQPGAAPGMPDADAKP